MDRPQLSESFLALWGSEVFPAAEKCAKGFKTINEMENGKEFAEDHEEMIFLKSRKDCNAIWYIGLLIGDVEKAKFHGTSLNLLNSLSAVNGCLNSESYWTNVWENDDSSEEAQNLRALAKLMSKIISL